MKLTSISCIMNDADIIETFVRVNASFIDNFIFIDDSDDGTAEILSRLEREGFRIIRLQRNKSEPYRQDLMVTSALKFAIDENIEGDYFIPLDSDEFPKFSCASDAHRTLAAIPKNHFGAFQWETYIPDTLDFDIKTHDGLQTSFSKRLPEGRNFEKVVIPRHLATEVYISVGSHSARRLDKRPLQKHILTEKLAHFPVRSANQIIKKNLSAVYWLMRKESRLKGEGYHVYEALKQLSENSFKMSLETLQKIAFEYANEPSTNTQRGEKPGWIQPYELRYTAHSQPDLLKEICSLLVASWIKPFKPDQISDLARVISRI
jgi:hypothetical protein